MGLIGGRANRIAVGNEQGEPMKRGLILLIFIAAFIGIGYYFIGFHNEPEQLTIGLVPSGNPETMRTGFEPIRAYLEEETGYRN